MSLKGLEKCDSSKNVGNNDKNEDEGTIQKTIPHSIASILNIADSEKKEEQKQEAEIENGTRDGKKQPGMKKSIVYPFMIRSEDKVEILPSTDVWIFKNDFNITKAMSKILCSRNTHGKMAKFLLSRLIGIDNFQYLSYNDNGKYIGLPEIILFVIKTFTKQSCQSRCKYSELQLRWCIEAIFKQTRKNIVTEIRCENNGEEITFPYMIWSTEKIELVPGSNVWISRNKLEEIIRKCSNYSCNYRHKRMVGFVLKDLLGTENLKYVSVGGYKICHEMKKYIQLPEDIFHAVLIYATQKCNSSIGCKGASFGSIGYRRYVVRLLKKARQKYNMLIGELDEIDEWHMLTERDEGKKEEMTKNEKNEKGKLGLQAKKRKIVFPYMIQNEEKVELVHGSDVWILKDDLRKIQDNCESTSCEEIHSKIICFLLNYLLHAENLKYMSISGRKNYIKLPKNVKAAILTYATQKCKATDCQVSSINNCTRYMDSILFRMVRSLEETDECRDSRGSVYCSQEIKSVSNTEENNICAEDKRGANENPNHSSDENTFASNFINLETNSAQTSQIRKRVNEAEQNDSILNKKIKVFENNSCSNQSKIFSPPTHVPKYIEPPRFYYPLSTVQTQENFCSTSYNPLPSNHVSAVANMTDNLYNPARIPTNNSIPFNQVSALANMTPLNNVPAVTNLNGKLYFCL